ncbi:MAG: DUF3667 domain-containing protein [Prevotella sp.]|nr:DUF3667 domain-containing protein [Prevotella sp.]
MIDLKKAYKRFRAWQENPFSYAMDETQTHHCHNCDYEYVGNFCPRCSQKANMGEVSWTSVREGVMEIWGMGSRSMTYTIWQLLWRPGYFVRDYITGKRQVSFAPVKMLLIVAILVTLIEQLFFPVETQSLSDYEGMNAINVFLEWSKKNQGWGNLAIYSMMIFPTWLMFRYSPQCSAHTLPQGFFLQVFMCVLSLIFTILSKLFAPFLALIPLYYILTYYQLFGYGLWGTLWRLGVCNVIATLIGISIVFLAVDYGAIESFRELDVPTWFMRFFIALLGIGISGVVVLVSYFINHWVEKRRTKKQKKE